MPWVGFVPSQKREKNAPPFSCTNPKRRDVVRLSWPLSRVASGRALKVRFFAFALSFSSSSSQMSSFFYAMSAVVSPRLLSPSQRAFVAPPRRFGKMPTKKRYLSPTSFVFSPPRVFETTTTGALRLSRLSLSSPRYYRKTSFCGLPFGGDKESKCCFDMRARF